MATLRKQYPVFYSPKFWGILAYTVLGYLQAKGWLGGNEVEALSQLILWATGIGVADSLARKIGKRK
tara:strand:+ start:593 stop:793 length:201 start_codon:yes stop_codon:yes gene_type:complete